MEIVKKCEWCHKTFIGQMVTARFCSSKCCNQAYRYKRNVQSGKCTPPDSTIDLSTLSRRVDEKKHFNDTLKDKQFLSPLEAAKLLGVCRSTIYNYLGLQELKEYKEKMSNEDFMAFKNGDLTKEEVIAKYHKPLIEGYIRREFSRPEKRSAALSLIENTIFGYMKLYASSTFVPSSNGDNNPLKRRNYDDIDDMNDEERKDGLIDDTSL